MHESPQLHSKGTPPGTILYQTGLLQGMCLFFKNKLKNPNFSVIYKFAVTGRAREASSYLHTAFIWALDQLLMTLVSG